MSKESLRLLKESNEYLKKMNEHINNLLNDMINITQANEAMAEYEHYKMLEAKKKFEEKDKETKDDER